MRIAFLSASLAAALLCGESRGANYDVDASHTSTVFSVSHLGYSYTYGMFRKNSGSFEYDAANPESSRFRFVIDVASLDTMDAKRDEHLRGADFFNANQFPEITFESTSVTKSVDERGRDVLNATGTLTLHGVSKEVTLPMVVLGAGPGPYGDQRVGFLCQTRLKRSDFGMEFMAGPIGDEVAVTISFEGIQK